MSYSLTLSFNNQTEALAFPVLPEVLEVTESGNNKTYEISIVGEINVIRKTKLAEISFESFFPNRWYPGANVSARECFGPAHYIKKINSWRTKKQPVMLNLIGSNLGVSMYVSIEKFTYSEEAGAVGDIKYQISFKEYRPYEAKKVNIQTLATDSGSKKVIMNEHQSRPTRPDTRILPTTYTLQPGDNLWKVAKKILGDDSKWRSLQKLNGITDAELKRLPVGKVIKLS
ncbi:LysM peptidoglycan-binding domain-containing protein [Paenibacillus guangzhouensis]|uniref:LysM peptidoglycan-binding domain-containing protein n=1 Tax=Paenibacillus guangzhouensis TaxID=1473112 RepID=UPI001266DAFC|nr:LysM peptidoglycan-binding domain-containing protein [Paenibacillus guangzhouensis]